jgi:hypothetical protein
MWFRAEFKHDDEIVFEADTWLEALEDESYQIVPTVIPPS